VADGAQVRGRHVEFEVEGLNDTPAPTVALALSPRTHRQQPAPRRDCTGADRLMQAEAFKDSEEEVVRESPGL
jgi:hypothetical protein